MSPSKRKFITHEKTAILREHLLEGVPVSKIHEKYGMSPSTVYGWRNKLFTEAPLIFGAENLEPEEDSPGIIDNGEPSTDWADMPSLLPPDFDASRLPPLIPAEIHEMMAEVAVPYGPSDERWQSAIIRWADPYHSFLEVTLPEPYLKIPEPEMNDLGLPDKGFYTTGDLCRLLDLHPDTFRYRLRSGIYPEARNRSGDKRRFAYEEARQIIEITKAVQRSKYKPRGK